MPADVRRKLEEAVDWLGERQPFLAEVVRPLVVRPDDRVTIASPDPAHRGLVVNPAAIGDLGVAAVAGALVGACLAAPGITGLSGEEYRRFLAAVEELWDGYLEEQDAEEDAELDERAAEPRDGGEVDDGRGVGDGGGVG